MTLGQIAAEAMKREKGTCVQPQIAFRVSNCVTFGPYRPRHRGSCVSKMSKSYFQWQDDNKVYRDFAPNIDRQLYAAFTSGAESIDVDLPSLGVYTINFKHMTQSQKSNQHRWRRIQYLGVASKNNSLGASSSSPQQFAGGNSRNLNPPNEKVSRTRISLLIEPGIDEKLKFSL